MLAGIDLAWTATGVSGLAVLTDALELRTVPAKRYLDPSLTAALLELTGGVVPDVVALDSPLVIPNRTGSRPAENALKAHRFPAGHIAVFASNQQFFDRYGGLRAAGLLHLWHDLRWPVDLAPGRHTWAFETYPRGVLASVFPNLTGLRYKGSAPKAVLLTGLAELQAALLGYAHAHQWQVPPNSLLHAPADTPYLADVLDAVLCLITAARVLKGPDACITFGTDWHQGVIVLPRPYSA